MDVKAEIGNLIQLGEKLSANAPTEVKNGLLNSVFTSLPVIIKAVEPIGAAYLHVRGINAGGHCAEAAKAASRMNLLIKFGLAMEIGALGVQYFRLKNFIILLENAKNLRDRSREKIIQAGNLMREVEELIKTFEKTYNVDGRTMNQGEFWQLNLMKDDIDYKLEQVMECIFGLEIQIGNETKILQLRGNDFMNDSILGVGTGSLQLLSASVAATLGNPVLCFLGLAVGVGRIALSGYSLTQYDASVELVKELQVELYRIQELGKQYKELKMKFMQIKRSIVQ